MQLKSTLAFITFACFASTGFAYEFENGVPLTLGFQLGETTVEDVQLRITGHDVELAISVRNATGQPQYAGFYAATPLFGSLGEGEENSDKTFPGLKAFHDGKPVRTSRHHRGFFLGRDITALLRKAGVNPIPSNSGDWRKIEKLPRLQDLRLENWQGQASLGWSVRLAPDSTALETIRYTALPKFALETIDADSFTQLVQQHCGSPEKLRDMLHLAAPEETLVLTEVFEFPLPSLALQDTRLTIEKPVKKMPGGRRFATLACGFDGAVTVPSDGTIHRATYSVSALVVSLLSSAPEK
ncbi:MULTISPECIES: hypothetical protein [unclassified Duganella]|uniref:hypothetical protein n=1 Tax=unclassified Duganella TaxID=2636909 RepID=UPI0006FA06F2|nr:MULTISPECIES: hypothetical protein [unclassified Duganella]KQV45364.1 hypothetical protein ASD07_17775 [Duganella sp. Root336D2]KRC02718.1 hypothetical protein ASE26_15985 [Duganella sp. Root198D2]